MATVSHLSAAWCQPSKHHHISHTSLLGALSTDMLPERLAQWPQLINDA